ncbi:DMT family transporter [Limnohabitans sp. Rim8]|uniref:DMT family transporter n=1 Tax=Limnohabitans sp. Rim8 TaxID=1100718 RepID=UPI002634DBD7|nr:DMT family transporter [Limnohabitans sp. Rim8]
MSQLFSDSARNRRIGIALVTVTTVMFAVLDASAKWLVMTLPVMQVVWMRFLTHSLFSIAVFAPSLKRDLWRWRHPRLQLLRGLMLASMTGLNFWALQYLQLAETGAMQFSVPILIALLSAWWLGERLDAKRWLAIAMGFVGVLVIIRPGSSGFHPAILLSALNAVLYALFNMMTRYLASSDNPATTQLTSAVVATLVMTPIALWQWQNPATLLEWLIMGLAGLSGGIGHYFVAVAHRYASAAVLGPFLYQQIIYMSVLGWWVFGQVPDLTVVLGTLVVVASGLYLLWREFQKPAPLPLTD